MATLQSPWTCFLPEIPKSVWRGPPFCIWPVPTAASWSLAGIATHFIGKAHTSPLSNQGKSFLQKLLRVLDNTIHTLQKIISGRLECQQEPWLSPKDVNEWTVGRTVPNGVSYHAFRGKAVTLFFPELRNKEAWWVKDGFPEQLVLNS